MINKGNSMICYAASPVNPPNPIRVLITTVNTTAKKLVTSQTVVVGASVYGGALAGHVIPQFHKKLITEGPVPAGIYVVDAVLKGKIDPQSPVAQSSIFVLKSIIKTLSKNQQKAAFDELSAAYGPKATEKLKKAIGYRGGDFFDVNWIHVYTKIYFLFLICLFAVTFVETLNSEMEKNPQIEKSFGVFYFNNIVPPCFKLKKKNFLLNSGYIADEIYLLNIDIDF